MEIRGDSLLGVPLLAISGEVDHSTAPALDKAIQESLGEHGSHLIVDLTSCRYLDSGGLAVFLYVVRQMRSRGGMAVVGANKNVRRLFEIVGLMQEPGLHMFTHADEAAAAIAGKA